MLEGSFGVLEQRLGVRSVRGIDSDARPSGEAHFIVIDHEG